MPWIEPTEETHLGGWINLRESEYCPPRRAGYCQTTTPLSVPQYRAEHDGVSSSNPAVLEAS